MCAVGGEGGVGRLKLDVYIRDSDMLPLTHPFQGSYFRMYSMKKWGGAQIKKEVDVGH